MLEGMGAKQGKPRFSLRPGAVVPGRLSPRVAWFVRWLVSPFARLMYRPVVRGHEHLPAKGAFLLVANHSGAAAIAEITSFIAWYTREVGVHRPLAGFAHPFAFRLPLLTTMMRGLGYVPSTYESALATLAQGVPLLVFPGGDHEATRPVWQANRVDFAGRKGFLRIAREAGVPIVPMGIRGAHYTVPIVWRSVWLLPRLLVVPWLFMGLKRYPVTLLAVLGAIGLSLCTALGPWRFALAAAWFASPLALLPVVPASISMQIGNPIAPDALFPDESDAALETAYARVEADVQQLVRTAGRRRGASLGNAPHEGSSVTPP